MLVVSGEYPAGARYGANRTLASTVIRIGIILRTEEAINVYVVRQVDILTVHGG